jgi:hypothetical protein
MAQLRHDESGTYCAYCGKLSAMEIRVIRRPPAPRMDGFDIRGLDVGRVSTADDRVGHYLISEGYAISAKTKDQSEQPKRKKRR